MFFLQKGSTERRFASASVGKGGHKKRQGSRETITLMASVFGTRFHSVLAILNTKCQDRYAFSAKAKEKLAAVGLAEGANTAAGVMLFIRAYETGWMQQVHINDHVYTQHHAGCDGEGDTPRSWRLSMYDNWTHFSHEERMRLKLSDKAIVQGLTPPRLSHIFNWLDVHFHGTQKRLYGDDTQKNMRNEELADFYRSSTGELKAGNQFITLNTLWTRFKTTFNNERYAEGYLRDWYRCGYGLNPRCRDETDDFFLEHAFGYKINEEPGADAIGFRKNTKGRKIDALSTSASELVSSTFMSGRKKHLKGFSSWSLAAIAQLRANRNGTERKKADPRPAFLVQVRTSAAAFVAQTMEKFGVDDFGKAPFSKQKRMMQYIMSSSDLWNHTEDGNMRSDQRENARRLRWQCSIYV